MNPTVRIRVVFFDLGGVLVHVHYHRLIDALAQEMGISASAMPPHLEALEPEVRLFDIGAIDGPEFHRRLIRRLRIDLDWPRFQALYTGIFSLQEEVAALAGELRGAARLSIISNTDPLHYGRILGDYPVIGTFERPVLSFRARAVKPDPAIFRYALAELEVKPEAALLIDDLAANTAAAQALGMQAIQFQDAQRLRKQLTPIFPRLLD
ncbi:MAG TPA: HAD-IA family hydrolase [bacterium]|nr:HAD-IA family hydrolase [bacterium]HQG47380.1 HAD-IA family hydrolase [bacterium]HQI48651.1 HAD-IA family hydrolase [bacterium]HQJ66101.1 HAD-IA family hydrolase [bacterium]